MSCALIHCVEMFCQSFLSLKIEPRNYSFFRRFALRKTNSFSVHSFKIGNKNAGNDLKTNKLGRITLAWHQAGSQHVSGGFATFNTLSVSPLPSYARYAPLRIPES